MRVVSSKHHDISGFRLDLTEEGSGASERDFVQADILDSGPHNGQATVLGREDINLIGALAHIAEETLDGIGGLNVPMHRSWKRIKCQRLLFLLAQASHGFGIAFAIFGLEGLQLDHGLLFAGLPPNRYEFGGNLSALSSGDRIEHIALLMDQAALTRRCRKQLGNGSQHAIMPVGHN